jgi:Tat protein secretion system quality control protein TatD with DNase activity
MWQLTTVLMMLSLMNSHIHLDDERFDFDREQLIGSAQQVSPVVIVPAVTVRFPAVLKLAKEHASVSCLQVYITYYIKLSFTGNLI